MEVDYINGKPAEYFIDLFNEIFRCTICHMDPKDAHICKACSKLYCLACITRWLNENDHNECPQCKGSLRVNELVRIRWVEDAIKSLERPDTSQQAAILSTGVCARHDQNMTFYCITCRVPVCNQCLNSGVNHVYHNFRTIQAIVTIENEKFDKEFDAVKARLKDIESMEVKFDKSMSDISILKKNKMREMQRGYEEAKKDLERQAETKMTDMRKRKDELQDAKVKLRRYLDEYESEVASNPGDETQIKFKFLEKFKEITQEPALKYSEICVPLAFKCYSPLTYNSGEFCLFKYGDLNMKECVRSESIGDETGRRWCLKIMKEEDDNFGAFVELKSGPPGS